MKFNFKLFLLIAVSLTCLTGCQVEPKHIKYVPKWVIKLNPNIIPTVTPPTEEQRKSKATLPIPKHWQERDAHFVHTIQNNIPVYALPTQNAMIMSRLAIADRVKVDLLLQDDYLTWAYLVDPYTDLPIGWIDHEQLAYASQYERVTDIPEMKIKLKKGDIEETITVKKNGSFVTKWVAIGRTGVALRGSFPGHLYQYDNILQFKAKRMGGIELFLMQNRDDTLSHEARFATNPLTVTLKDGENKDDFLEDLPVTDDTSEDTEDTQ